MTLMTMSELDRLERIGTSMVFVSLDQEQFSRLIAMARRSIAPCDHVPSARSTDKASTFTWCRKCNYVLKRQGWKWIAPPPSMASEERVMQPPQDFRTIAYRWRHALAWLVRLKDKIKETEPTRYEKEKPLAWEFARTALEQVEGQSEERKEDGPNVRLHPGIDDGSSSDSNLHPVAHPPLESGDSFLTKWTKVIQKMPTRSDNPSPPTSDVAGMCEWISTLINGYCRYVEVDREKLRIVFAMLQRQEGEIERLGDDKFILEKRVTTLTAQLEAYRAGLEKIAGGSFHGASTLAVNGDWKGFVEQLQSIANALLKGDRP